MRFMEKTQIVIINFTANKKYFFSLKFTFLYFTNDTFRQTVKLRLMQ